MAAPLRRLSLTVGASCAIHAGLIGAILVAGHWLSPIRREVLPILPVEVVTSPDEPKPQVTPPPPPPKPSLPFLPKWLASPLLPSSA